MNDTQALTKIEPMPATPSVEAMITLAVERGATVETLERLMAIRREVRAEQAKEAFDRALANFQAECPTIQKTAKVMNKDGRSVRYQYAPLDAIIHQVKGILQRNGFSYSVNAKAEPTAVLAVCKLTHAYGHSETSEFSVPIDKDAYMNPAQQVASALTFAKRYAFCNACGIMTGDQDDDSQGSHEGNAKDNANARREPPKTSAKPAAKPAEPKQATAETRKWFIAQMLQRFDPLVVLQWACDDGPPYRLTPNETLEDWPLAHVPTSRQALDEAIARCAAFMSVEPRKPAETPQKPAGASAPPSTTATPASCASEAKPEPKKGDPEPEHHQADWYTAVMPWGKQAGKQLGKLDKKYLYGLWRKYTVETEYNGKPKSKAAIEKDRQFRVWLDQAGVHYKFDEPKDAEPQDAGDPGAEADEPMPF